MICETTYSRVFTGSEWLFSLEKKIVHTYHQRKEITYLNLSYELVLTSKKRIQSDALCHLYGFPHLFTTSSKNTFNMNYLSRTCTVIEVDVCINRFKSGFAKSHTMYVFKLTLIPWSKRHYHAFAVILGC